MNLIWNAQDVLRAVNGQCLQTQDWTAKGVSIDSRSISEGDLFIAIKGPACDGHDYVHTAFEAGACAAIVDKQPPQVPVDAILIFVEDTFAAMQALGRASRARANAKIIGVTGSVGKTSTKEQLRQMLGTIDDTYANVGSFNNHWGVPLSLARLPQEAKFGVFELGMNHAGEMETLSKDVLPDVALINNIEAVHLEFFKNTEAIAEAKSEIFLGMNEKGCAVINRDTPHFDLIAKKARAQGIKKILSFGRHEKSDAHLIKAEINGSTTEVKASIFGKEKNFIIGAPGEHLALNALGGLLVCAALDTDVDQCIEALAGYRTPEGRGSAQTIQLKERESFILIDQSFNASPAATAAAIQVLGQTGCDQTAPRRVAVLGDMGELGPTAPELHLSLLKPLIDNRIDVVHCCGPIIKHLYDELPVFMRGSFTQDSQSLAQLVAEEIQDGDIVMVKGSKATKMNKIIDALLELSNESKEKIAI